MSYEILKKLSLWKNSSWFYDEDDEKAYKDIRNFICDVIDDTQKHSNNIYEPSSHKTGNTKQC